MQRCQFSQLGTLEQCRPPAVVGGLPNVMERRGRVEQSLHSAVEESWRSQLKSHEGITEESWGSQLRSHGKARFVPLLQSCIVLALEL